MIAEESLRPESIGQLHRALVGQPVWSDLPLVILTRVGLASRRLVREAEALGNATFVERPVRITTLINAAQVALRTSTPV